MNADPSIIGSTAPATETPDMAAARQIVDRLENLTAMMRFVLQEPNAKPANVACLLATIAEVAQRCADQMEARA